MANIKIYGNTAFIRERREAISTAIHAAVMEALDFPEEKRFHRFVGLERDDFIYPDDRSECYLIIEVAMFSGRTQEARKRLIRLLFANLEEQAGIVPQDVEITLFEIPRENWGIRGVPGDELVLNYTVEV